MEKPLVLIVDEEALIRISAVHMAENAGYPVLQASGADDAINLLESRYDIRAVFTDIKMSGSLDGLELAHAIRERWPPIQLIVTSGLDMADKLPANARFIRKPYFAEQVAAVLHELFGQSTSPGGLLSGGGKNRGKLA
jgi:CheY-like chemotaxis protein